MNPSEDKQGEFIQKELLIACAAGMPQKLDEVFCGALRRALAFSSCAAITDEAIFNVYDEEIKRGGSADSIILRTVRRFAVPESEATKNAAGQVPGVSDAPVNPISSSPDPAAPTPRTDAAWESSEDGNAPGWELCRQLERELSECVRLKRRYAEACIKSASSASAEPVAWRSKHPHGYWVYFEEFPRYEQGPHEPLYPAPVSSIAAHDPL